MLKSACIAYRTDESLLLRGDLIRLKSPFIDGYFAEMTVSKDKGYAKLTVMYPQPMGNDKFYNIKLYGLDENSFYSINGGEKASGSALVNRGFYLPQTTGDYKTLVVYFERINGENND